MKTLKDYISASEIISESKGIEYRVAFIGANDDDDLPINATIIVDPKDRRNFEDFLNNNEGDLFMHASGGGVEF